MKSTSSIWTPGFIAFLVVLLVLLIAYALTVRRNSVNARFESVEKSKGFMKYMAMLGLETARVLPDSMVRVNRVKEHSMAERLRRSGNPWNITPEEFMIIKIGGCVFGCVFGLLTYFLIKDFIAWLPWYVYMIAMGLVGFLLPDRKCSKLEEQRQLAFRKELPEALDLLIIANSVDSAMPDSIRKITPLLKDGIVKDEFKTVSADLNAGRPLDQALTGMAERAPSPEIEGFVSTVIQANEQGQDVTDALRRRAKASRAEYIALLDRKIASLSSRIMIALSPTMILAMMLVAVGPSLSSIVGAL